VNREPAARCAAHPVPPVVRALRLVLLVLIVAPATLGSTCSVSGGGWRDGSAWRESWPGGIGAVLGHSSAEHRLTIRQVPPDSPAAEAGLRPDDEILKIDNRTVAELALSEIVAALRGEVGSRVKLHIRRGDDEFDVEVVRAPYRED
jgi:membrane-associated protease RseP (regulator of RpoE activity)